MQRLTKYDLALLPEGTKVQFAMSFSGVPVGAIGTIKENGFNEIWSAMLVGVDDPSIDAMFYDEAERTVHLSGGNPSSEDAQVDPSWTALSPLALVVEAA